jgi:pyruvate dehydrogenase E2 component (dihydrolipoamide acetyltransferase)
VRIQELSAAECTIARRAAESRATVPDLELSATITVEGEPSTATIVRACGRALREHPRANGSYRDGRFELYSRVNVGIVVAATDVYAIPTLFDADRKPVAELEGELERLVRGAIEGRLTAASFSGATFTLWHAAEFGLRSATIPPVPPQAAALTAGAVRDRELTLTLACDHRILYGAAAAAFLTAVSSRLEGSVR